MKELPNEQQLFSSKDGSTWIPHLDGKLRTDISSWLHQNLTWTEFQEIVNPPKSNDELIAQCKLDLAGKRWEVATGGVIIDGISVQSDDKSKDEMAGYVTESIVNGLVNVNWKLADGTFKVYTVQEFKKVYQFVAKYRNDCFGVEREKLDEINANGTTDLETGWPDNNFVIV